MRAPPGGDAGRFDMVVGRKGGRREECECKRNAKAGSASIVHVTTGLVAARYSFSDQHSLQLRLGLSYPFG